MENLCDEKTDAGKSPARPGIKGGSIQKDGLSRKGKIRRRYGPQSLKAYTRIRDAGLNSRILNWQDQIESGLNKAVVHIATDCHEFVRRHMIAVIFEHRRRHVVPSIHHCHFMAVVARLSLLLKRKIVITGTRCLHTNKTEGEQ
tara:strand:- start:143 stop:574 length:432 start_codon:yes stop_codon:yes gene_type:complete